ncbi:MAG: transporter [Lachnospiraceae bacterium]|nr:transporter [Lachnospiraceae bacterium]
MEELVSMGFISIIPALIAIILSFAIRNTIISLAVACIVGTILAGQGVFGFPTLLKESLGTTSFSWVMLLNTLIAIIVAYFQKTGAIQSFSQMIHDKNLGRRGAQLMAWVLGMFVYFSDSFSPLFVGSTMRSITDKAKISREKLAYIADSTSAPVSVLVPITGWAAYLSGLAVGIGCIATTEDGSALFLKALPYNFYAILAVIMVGLIGSGIVKDFGPMKKAEKRAMEEGKVLRDGAIPLIGKELTEMQPYEGLKPWIFLNFILPVLMIISIALGTYITLGSAKTMEAFLFVVIFMTISMVLQGIPFQEVMNTFTDGIKGAVPAVTLLALAYSINSLSSTMGTANYIVSLSQDFLTPALLPAIIFLISAIMAFATGSSWGTFAICMPIALPLAFAFTGNTLTPLVYASFAAVAGGGVFGDHCSPLSDTTVLSSTGSACDHIDHVQTQLPYALCCGTLATVLYLVIGFVFI